jgi:RNA polymerase sigma-70 factor (ECF subfamily)
MPPGSATTAYLQRILVDRYEELKALLRRRLGSTELASEALHETFVRLEQSARDPEPSRPMGYLYRAAMNVAADQRRRLLPVADLEAQETELLDPAANPESSAAGRQMLALLGRVFAELPPRQQIILRAAKVQGLTHREIGVRLGVSRRTVVTELGRALAHCSQRLAELSEGRSREDGLLTGGPSDD